jgi:hypothetical protein
MGAELSALFAVQLLYSMLSIPHCDDLMARCQAAQLYQGDDS